MIGPILSSSLAAALILAGLFLPPATLIHSLRIPPPHLLEQLLLGATLFKIGLVVLGLAVIACARFPRKASPERATPSSTPPSKYTLVAILFAAGALRVYRLDSGLWHDEIVTYVKYAKIPFGEILSTYGSENQHFLYSLLARASLSIFGDGTWSLRLPAVLFGVASIWALYLLAREVASAWEVLLSAALLAFSYHHVWFSQNARGYTGLLFWTLLASWLFLRALREARARLWVLYAIATALGIYTHITMLFVAVGHFLMYLMTLVARRKETWPDRWAGSYLGFGLAGLLTLQLHALVLPQVFAGIRQTESVVAGWKRPAWTLLEFLEGVHISFAGTILAIAALLVFGAGFWSFQRTHPVVIQLLVIPALIGAATVLAMGHHLWPRFFFFTVGFGALVLVRGTMRLGHAATRLLRLPATRSVPLGAAFSTALIAASAISLPSAYGPKQDYLGALSFVEASKEPADAVVTVGLATFAYKSLYKVDWEAAETLTALNSIRSRTTRTWVLYTLRPVLESASPDIMASIQRDFRVVKQFPGTLGAGTIFVCRSDTPPT